MNDLQARRKKNLRALIKQWEGPTNLARKLHYRGPSYLSQMIGPHKPVTEKTARAIEAALALPNGWLDADHATPSGAGHIDTALISRVLLAISAVLDGSGVVLSSPRMAGLVSLCYEHAAEHGNVVDDDYVHRLVSLITTKE